MSTPTIRPISDVLYLDRALKYERDVSTAKSQSEALEAAIAAAENYMKALSLTSSAQDKQRLDFKCKEWLSRAEAIKEKGVWQTPDPENNGPVLQEPVSTKKLSTREEIIILGSSKLNQFVFPPWKEAPEPKDFNLEQHDRKFEDKELKLSASQKKVFNGWKRPDELFTQFSHLDSKSSSPPIVGSGVMDLVQDVTTDCSVVASLCAAIARTERGHGTLFRTVMFPYDYTQNAPRLSLSGKYIFRFHFNGCYRKVVIDDRLPSSKTSRSLFVIDRNNPHIMWPALLEKAYLKIRGGYDFPGSNSGTDLWVLTGWIPEQIFLHHEDVTPNQLWKRIADSFQYGDVIVTIGTGELNQREESQGFISRHDYAVLDLLEEAGRRQILIKNPWADPVSKIPGSYRRTLEEQEIEARNPRNPLLPGSFWMDYDQIFQNFENLYLNWNPGLFRCRQDIHFVWDLSKPRLNQGCFAGNPQFAVSTEAGGPVWLLLSKHFRTIEVPGAGDEPGFISLYVYKERGQRVILSEGAFYRGPFVDSPNTLARIDMDAHSSFTIVVAEQSLALLPQNFTLSAFSRNEVALKHAEMKYSHEGGNTESPRYPSNPQFVFQITEEADISILLETSDLDLAIHVKLFWSDGKRVSSVKKRDIITDSGDYRPGCVVAATNNLRRGSYTIVCSTFAPDQIARFNLWVSSTRKCHVKTIPPEAAGRLPVISDIGVLPPGTDRIIAPLRVPRLTRIKLIARSRESTIGNRHVASSPMLMTIEIGQGPYKEILAASENGEFSDAISGIKVPDLDIRPEYQQQGGIWIVVERIGGPGGQITDHIDVEALGEERVEIGEWIVP
ncbi:calpain-like protease PalBory [Talaromyces proteolyticus]|uniref:Calpain-like protease PalBory n=1 Tax=Talaromyces proteolyticus TaxID=1131652 RepID=A0AAD4Q2Q0_9EURO|nr:calpain-like protease PalBory [Talaromyces proteolyticus]KAH8700627.1 calpain-like protease PalBory [Talaromyces proteolyticus]